MSTDRRSRRQNALVLPVALAVLALVVATGLVLREHAPGNMGVGLLVGTGGAPAVAGRWRGGSAGGRGRPPPSNGRGPSVVTSVTTPSSPPAGLGLLALPLTALAAIEFGVGAVAFAVIYSRS